MAATFDGTKMEEFWLTLGAGETWLVRPRKWTVDWQGDDYYVPGYSKDVRMAGPRTGIVRLEGVLVKRSEPPGFKIPEVPPLHADWVGTNIIEEEASEMKKLFDVYVVNPAGGSDLVGRYVANFEKDAIVRAALDLGKDENGDLNVDGEVVSPDEVRFVAHNLGDLPDLEGEED